MQAPLVNRFVPVWLRDIVPNRVRCKVRNQPENLPTVRHELTARTKKAQMMVCLDRARRFGCAPDPDTADWAEKGRLQLSDNKSGPPWCPGDKTLAFMPSLPLLASFAYLLEVDCSTSDKYVSVKQVLAECRRVVQSYLTCRAFDMDAHSWKETTHPRRLNALDWIDQASSLIGHHNLHSTQVILNGHQFCFGVSVKMSRKSFQRHRLLAVPQWTPLTARGSSIDDSTEEGASTFRTQMYRLYMNAEDVHLHHYISARSGRAHHFRVDRVHRLDVSGELIWSRKRRSAMTFDTAVSRAPVWFLRCMLACDVSLELVPSWECAFVGASFLSADEFFILFRTSQKHRRSSFLLLTDRRNDDLVRASLDAASCSKSTMLRQAGIIGRHTCFLAY